jgi:pilus assembly protein Flp/PilA
MVRREESKKNSKKERGATLVEYALLVALVALGSIGALGLLRDNISTGFTNVGTQLSNAIPAGGGTTTGQ